MKKGAKYVSTVAVLLTVLTIVNYFSYQSAVRQFDEKQQNYEQQMTDRMQVYVSKQMEQQEKALKEYQNEKALREASAKKLVTEKTIYEVNQYDKQKNSTSTEYRNVPDEWIGCNKAGIEKYIHDYYNNMPVQEYLAGLQNIEVTSYSADRIEVRKTYDPSKIKYRYYLIADDKEVLVYYSDQKTIYQHTGIKITHLTKQDRDALKKGINVKNDEELYGILENFSS